MSEANPICVICGIRVICESLGSEATHNPREYRPDGNLRNPRNLRDFTLYDICEKSAYLRNLRETFYGKEGWVGADAPRRVPTRWDIWGEMGNLGILGVMGGLGGRGKGGGGEVGQKVRMQERPAEVVEA